MPTAKNTVTAYVDDDIKGCLTDYSKEKGISQSKALEEILTIFFKGDVSDNVPSNVLKETVRKEVEKRLGETNASAVDMEAVIEEKLLSYQSNFNEALAKHMAAIDKRLEEALATSNLDADFAQKDLSTTSHNDEPIPPQPQPPVVPRKTDTNGGEWITGVELGKRLGLADGSAISKHKKDPKHFADYTQVRDPDGIAWKWNGKDKKNARYAPISH